MTGRADVDTANPQILYLIKARCPDCDEVSQFVEERDAPVDLMQDVGISAGYCPHCGVHMWTEGYEWDIHEEAEVEPVQPTQESDL